MKTVFTDDAFNKCTISFDNIIGMRETLNFYAPRGGGYVRMSNGNQICRGLSGTGPTLWFDGKMPLIHLIRHEYKLMRIRETAQVIE